MNVPLKPIHWLRSYRIIPAARTEERIFGGIGGEDASILYELDAATRPPRRVKVDFVDDCFRYRSESRFSNGEYGVYYSAATIHTAIKETRYHKVLFLSKTDEDPMDLPMRAFVANIKGDFHDIRKMKRQLRDVYSSREADYKASQAFGKKLYLEGSKGISFLSVRDAGGQCLVVFDPECISNVHEERRLVYHWDGKTIPKVSQVETFLAFGPKRGEE